METTFVACGIERTDAYDPVFQLARRMEKWLDDLALSGALSPAERRSIHLAVGEGRWEWQADEASGL